MAVPTTTRTVAACPAAAVAASMAAVLVAAEATRLVAVVHLVVAVAVSSPLHEPLLPNFADHTVTASGKTWHLINSHITKSENNSFQGVFRSSTTVD